MIRHDARQSLTLLATLLTLFLIVGFWGLKPLNAVVICVLVLLISGVIFWYFRRSVRAELPVENTGLPPEDFSGRVILVTGDTCALFGEINHRETRQGWYIKARQPCELIALVEQLAQQRSALIPQLSILLALIPERNNSIDELTQQQNGWQRAFLESRRVLKDQPPLWTVLWASPADDNSGWFSLTPDSLGLLYHPEDNARLSLAEWVELDAKNLHHALRLQSLMRWYANFAAASHSVTYCQMGICLTPVTSLPKNLWLQHNAALTTLRPNHSSVEHALPLPDVLLSNLPHRQGISRRLLTLRHAGVICGVFLILAMLASFMHNQRLVRSVSDHLTLWRSLPSEAIAAKTLARDQLVDDRRQLDVWYRSGEPLSLGLGLYQGMRLIAPVNAAIHSWAPPPPPAPIIKQVVQGPQTVRLDSLSLFESGKASLRTGSDKVLINALVGIKARPGWLIVVAGHTDSTGHSLSNQQLSLKRAEAVRDWMRDTGDVPESCFAVQGYGQDRPIATNESAEGRALNRRVEIRLVPQADACRASDSRTLPSQDDGNSQSEKE